MGSYWYAIQCATGNEIRVRERFDRLFPQYRSFFPRRMLRERQKGQEHTIKKPLFSGYFFFASVKELLSVQAFELIKSLNSESVNFLAYRVLGTCLNSAKTFRSGDIPVRAIAADEMKLLLELTSDDEIIYPSLLVVEGRNLKIMEGALKGHEGILLKFDRRKSRAKILLSFLGETRVVDVAAEALLFFL